MRLFSVLLLPALLLYSACTATKSGDAVAGADSGNGPVCPVGGSPTGLTVGDCAPNFTLPDRSGALVSLSDQRGKVALVDISAVW